MISSHPSGVPVDEIRRPMAPLVLLAPLRIEAAAVRAGARGVRVERVGMGRARAEEAAGYLARVLDPASPVMLIGLAGGLSPTDRAGDVVVATELMTDEAARSPEVLDRTFARRIEQRLASSITGVRSGPIYCTENFLHGSRAASLAPPGALACEMESAWLAPIADGRPFAVVRVIVDRPGRPLLGPWTISGGISACRRLAAVARLVASQLVDETTRA